MKAKEYLRQLQKLDIMVEQKIQEIDKLKNMLEGLKGIDYSQERVKSNQANYANFESIVIKIIDLENEISKEIDKFVDKKHDIINIIQGLENCILVQLLYKRYVEYKGFEKIAIEMNYHYSYIRRLHKIALQEIQKVLDKKYNMT